MFKKFIFAFIVSLGFIKCIDTSADVIYEKVLTHDTYYDSSIKDVYFSRDALENTTQFSQDGYNFIKPVMVRVADSNTNFWNIRFCVPNITNDVKTITKNGNVSYRSGGWSESFEKAIAFEYYYVPVFDDYNNASLYSRGMSYDASHIVGGTVPIDYLIGLTERDNRILGFESNMLPVNSGINNYWKSGEMVFRIQKTYQYNLSETDLTNNHVMINVNVSVPNLTSINTYWSQAIGASETDLSEFNDQTTRILIQNNMNSDVNAVYDSNGNKLSQELYETFNITYDIDYCINEGFVEDTIDQGFGYEGEIHTYKLTDRTFNSQTSLGSISYIPKGITGMLISYYGSTPKAMLALNYMNVNYVSCWSYDVAKYMVYNPVNFMYPDQKGSAGTIWERRRFTSTLNITPEEIKDPEETDNKVGDNETPVLDIPQNTIDHMFDTTIQDSYNQVTNNYYYDYGLTENILDYYRGFSDGATDENIDSALGYVKTTLGGLTHIPLLLGYCFTGFFPPEVLMLFYALLIIFVVFMIIRIIKHLFTH